MIMTSVSLSATSAVHWRRHRRQILKFTIRTLRILIRQNPIRRGVARQYNRNTERCIVVTTRFTESEYDTLHYAAAMMRVSVSWIVERIIKLWKKPERHTKDNAHVSNYDIYNRHWTTNICTSNESLLFWSKKHPEKILRAS